MILVLTRTLGRYVAFIRLQQIASKHLYCHEKQQKHRREPKQLGQDLHQPYFDTRGIEANKLLNLKDFRRGLGILMTIAAQGVPHKGVVMMRAIT